MNKSSIIQAELTWFEGEFIPGARVTLGDDGRISKVQRGVDDAPTHPGRALLPGFVNAHSHAFPSAQHRLLREPITIPESGRNSGPTIAGR